MVDGGPIKKSLGDIANRLTRLVMSRCQANCQQLPRLWPSAIASPMFRPTLSSLAMATTGNAVLNGATSPVVVDDDDSDSGLTHDEILMQREEDAFYRAPENDAGDDDVWGLLSGVVGNIYEWYDFAVYGLLASEIGAAFFPDSSKELQLINSFGVYLAAFLMRPIGAVLFGELGDRLVGRKNALVFSIVLITVPSVLMGLLPSYEQWGVVAPILLVLLRMIQGMSVGGQLAGSYVLSIEQSTQKNRGLRGSICDASSVSGFLLASGITTAVRSIFTEEQVDEWAWRVPFWVSLLLAPCLFFIVRHSKESKFWEDRADQKETEQIIREEEQVQNSAVRDLFSSPFRRRQLAYMIGVMSPYTGSFYILFLWVPIYLSDLRGFMDEKTACLINFIIVGLFIILEVIAGKISDKCAHRIDSIRIGVAGIMMACPVMFSLFETETMVGYVLGQFMLCFCSALVCGAVGAWEVELWMGDPTLSFTGVAIGHNTSATLFGGTLPVIATFLYYRSEELVTNYPNNGAIVLFARMLPGLYISLLTCLSLYCSYAICHPHDIRTGERKIREAYQKEQRRKRKRLMRTLSSMTEIFTTSPRSGGTMEMQEGDRQNDGTGSYSPPVGSGLT